MSHPPQRLPYPEELRRTLESLASGDPVAKRLSTGESPPIDDERPAGISVLAVSEGDTSLGVEGVEDVQGIDITLTSVSRVEDALDRLADGDVDCLLAEYGSDSPDGIDHLERAGECDPSVPSLLVYEEGSESVVHSADGIATDYLSKREARRLPLLARRLRLLAERRRLHRRVDRDGGRLAELRRALELVREETGIYVWNVAPESADASTPRDGGGSEPNADDGASSIPAGIDPAWGSHHRPAREIIEAVIDGDGAYRTEYAAPEPDAADVWIEEYGRIVPDETRGVPSVFGISRDVSARKARDRELERERELNRTLHEALVEFGTRGDLEGRIVQQLHEHGYDLVWIGDSFAGEIRPRAVAGTGQYLHEVELAPGDRGTDSALDPTIRAVREREVRFVDDVTTLPDSAWSRTASRFGLRAVAALPLAFNGILYGAIAVYDEAPEAFDETTKRLLTEFSETLAFVVHNVETEASLAADRTVRATLQLNRTEYYLCDLVRGADCDSGSTRLLVHETLPQDDEHYLQYVSVTGATERAIVEAADSHPVVEDATIIAEETNPRIQLIHAAETPETSLTRVGTRVQSTSVTAGRVDILVDVPSKNALGNAIDALEATNESVSVLTTIERGPNRSRAESGPLAALTDRQATVLKAAYHRGYFERPRESSATEVAASLGISHPTLLEHLRLAQEKVFRHHFG